MADMMCCACASCGIAEVDNTIKLMRYSGCDDLVRYCSVKCQAEHRHRSQHTRDCKSKAAEMREMILFRQPESSHLGDCPICLLLLSLDPKKSIMQSCCTNLICLGCY